jgi:hypothetical protein
VLEDDPVDAGVGGGAGAVEQRRVAFAESDDVGETAAEQVERSRQRDFQSGAADLS